MRKAYTVQEFCEQHGGISKVFFYDLLKRGLGPNVMKVGRRTMVSEEAAQDWRHRMEQVTDSVASKTR